MNRTNLRKSFDNNALGLIWTSHGIPQRVIKFGVYLATNQGVVGSIPASRTRKDEGQWVSAY